MSEMTREEYRARLSEGETVYFVGGSRGYNIPSDPLDVLKGTVTDASEDRRYPVVNLWRSRAEDPVGTGLNTMLSPRQLFTTMEVSEALQTTNLPLDQSGELPIDQLLDDPFIHAESIALLGSISMARLIEDEIRRPGDPEY